MKRPAQPTETERLHHLLALGAVCIDQSKPYHVGPGSDTHVCTDSHLNPIDPSHELIPAGSTDTRGRIAIIMDALAGICISQPQHEAFAVGVQMDHGSSSIRLVVAGNASARGDQLEIARAHLIRVWDKLKEIARLHVEQRIAVDREVKRKNWVHTSHEIQQQLGEGAEMISRRKELRKMVVRHAVNKLYQRLKKRWGAFTEFSLQFARFRDADGFSPRLRSNEELKAIEHIREIIIETIDMGDKLKEDKPFTSAWPETRVRLVCKHLRAIDTNFKAIRHNSLVRVLLSLLPGPAFPFEHFIKKIVSLYEYTNTLLSWARSPRLHHTFLMSLTIDTLYTNPKTLTTLPTTISMWKALIIDIISSSGFEEDALSSGTTTISYINNLATAAYNMFSTTPASADTSPIHCEVALITHYHTFTNHSRWSHVPPFTYIGASKGACLCCHYWLTAYTRHTQRQFTLRGTHAKFCYPWQLPPFRAACYSDLEVRIAVTMAGQMARVLLDRWVEEGLKILRKGSGGDYRARVSGGNDFERRVSNLKRKMRQGWGRLSKKL
ncbi:hypothetical protein Hypma_013206 [Hypsizygus marmoreus]|uniref:Uncharacterized protein n=1 Tax=Hypsizygus marmoreus TaxID=39966 RepID=A0A369JC82_HYPMA|nr:hypothetical protein Hypma_013206 [Hypsizygus marmoreus]